MLDTGPIACILILMSTEMIVVLTVSIPFAVFVLGAWINDKVR